MPEHKKTIRIGLPGRLTIGRLLITVFVSGLLVSAASVYLAFTTYRMGAVRTLADADGQRIASLVYENLYSVMRKGANRGELDDLVHHIQGHLTDYQVAIVRAEPVAKQYGERPGQAEWRQTDLVLADVLKNGRDFSGTDGRWQRYLLPVKVTGECLTCHSVAHLGDINGVIDVRVPLNALEAPIAALAYPMMYLVLGLLFVLLLVTFLILRALVSRPIQDLALHVNDLFTAKDYTSRLHVGRVWPNEVRSLAVGFNRLMRQVRSSQQRLAEISLRDPLTGLFNRRHFDAVLERAVAEGDSEGHAFAVLLIDLDRFKPINDQYGHAAGDALLIAVGKALMANVRESEVPARIGGDEFAVLAFPSSPEGAIELAHRLRTAVAACTLRLGQEQVSAACSIGISVFPDGGLSASDLLHAADVAMYEDKQTRKRARI